MDHPARRIIRVTSAVALFGLSACTVSWPGTSDPSAIHYTQQGPASHVIVRDDDYFERKYSPLGEVRVALTRPSPFHPNPTRDTVNQRLREEAAKLGADAVILVRYATLDGGFLGSGTFEGKGLAIKFLP